MSDLKLKVLEDWCKKMVDEVSKKTHQTAPETIKMVNEVKGDIGEMKGDLRLLKDSSIRIEKHVEKTNGSVAKNSLWRTRISTVVIVFAFLFPTLIGVFAYFMSDMEEDITNQITIMINENNSEYFE